MKTGKVPAWAAAMIISSALNGAAEEMGADFIGKGFMEYLHVHGLTEGTHNAFAKEGDTYVLSGISASTGDGTVTFSAREIKITGLREEEKADPWLLLDRVVLKDAVIGYGNFKFSAPEIQIGNLSLHHTNTKEDAKENAYENIDGPLDAFKFASISGYGIGVELSGSPVAADLQVDIALKSWLSNPVFPEVAKIEIQGHANTSSSVLALAGSSSLEWVAFRFEGGLSANTRYGLAEITSSLNTSSLGSIAGRASVAKVKNEDLRTFRDMLSMLGGLSGPTKLPEATISNAVVATRNLSWIGMPDKAQTVSHSILSAFPPSEARKFMHEVFSKAAWSNENSVTEYEPEGRISLGVFTGFGTGSSEASETP